MCSIGTNRETSAPAAESAPETSAPPTTEAPAQPAPKAPSAPAVPVEAAEPAAEPTTEAPAQPAPKAPSAPAVPVEAAEPAAEPTTEAPPTAPAQPAPTPEPPTRVALSRIRQKIAANLVQSKAQAAHLTTFNEVDMSEVIALRAQYKQLFEERHAIRLGFMSFFVQAASHALRARPVVNAYLEDNTIIYNEHCNIGVALAADQGLIVPVIRNAETKGFAAIEREIKQFAVDAQAKRLLPSAFSGGTFTITNGGIFGSLFSTPIPTPPQTAILGMHAINERPAVVNGAVAVRPLMYLALTYDHRLIDGKEAVGFLKMIKESIEEPARLMLDI